MRLGSPSASSLLLVMLVVMSAASSNAYSQGDLEQMASVWRLEINTRFKLNESPEPGLARRSQRDHTPPWTLAERQFNPVVPNEPSEAIYSHSPLLGFPTGNDEIFEPAPGMYRRIGIDVVDLVREPASMKRGDWFKVGAIVATIGAVSLLDDEIRANLRFNTDDSQSFARTIRPLGQEASIFFLGASWLAGTQWDRPVFRAVAVDGFEASVLASGFIAPILKRTLGRSRPYLEYGSSSFGASESFPSGEATQAFAVASVVAAHSESRWVDVIAYSLAGLTAWQRIELDAHWASDVVAGAAIGTAIGRWVVKRNLGSSTPRWTLSPTVGQGGGGLLVRLNFGGQSARPSRAQPWEGT
ncbi:MAG: phosphatase PAP2 family protein [Thermoanaerobaculia bacterium]|nr:phosphatase PAP2 family protein [Thermoanaerobaculia bacterium]